MKRIALLAAVAAALAGCAHDGTTTTVVTPPAPLVCPASATAAIEPEPTAPPITGTQQEELDVATLTILGPELGEAVLTAEAMRGPWGRRGWARVEDVARFCRENAD